MVLFRLTLGVGRVSTLKLSPRLEALASTNKASCSCSCDTRIESLYFTTGPPKRS